MVGNARAHVRTHGAPVGRVVAFAIAAMLGAACNLLNGSADLETSAVPAGGVVPDGSARTEGGSGADGGNGTPGTDAGDAAPDAGSGFVADAGVNPTLMSCGSNLICLPDVAGWTPAAYLPAGAPPKGGGGCPAGYPQENDLTQSGGGRCDCVCTANGGSCAGSVSAKKDAACSGAASDLALASGACHSVTLALPLPVAFSAQPAGSPPTSCGAMVVPELNAPRPVTFCTGAVASAGTCGQGEICVDKPSLISGGFTCIVHDGDIACPNRLPFRTLVGTTVTDGRSCNNTCACQTERCSGTLEAFSDTACATSVRSVAADGTCITAGAAMSGSSYRYTASLGCGVSTPATVLGSETYTGTRTLCCTFGF